MNSQFRGLDEKPEEAAAAILAALGYLEQEALRAGLDELADSIRAVTISAVSETAPRPMGRN